MNKKGVSAVIVTVLIILIAIIAVSMLWVAIRSSIDTSLTQVTSAQQCLGINLKIEEVKYYSTQNNLTVKIHRDAGEGVMSGIKIVHDGKISNAVSLEELETKTYLVESVTTKPAKVEIAIVLEDSTICPVSDKKEGSQVV
ncbi:MAG: hypothetical protein ABIG37_02275 [Nanoarchaeota archaeon]|nr:hypothetical protein [Nanoarchaeota archaeon]